jgi:hypothetical protein
MQEIGTLFFRCIVLNKARSSEHKLHEKFKAEKTVSNQFHFRARGVADPGCLSRIRIFPSRTRDPGSRVKKIPDPGSGSASKNLSIFNPINCFYALGNMIRNVHPKSGSYIFIPPGSRGQKGTGFRIRIRNIAS